MVAYLPIHVNTLAGSQDDEAMDRVPPSHFVLFLYPQEKCGIFSLYDNKEMIVIDQSKIGLSLSGNGILMNLHIQPCKEIGADHVTSVSMFNQHTTTISDSMISVKMRSTEIFAHVNRQLNNHEDGYNFNVPIAQFNLLDVGKSSEIIDISRKHLE
jgi:hypothetical protein